MQWKEPSKQIVINVGRLAVICYLKINIQVFLLEKIFISIIPGFASFYA